METVILADSCCDLPRWYIDENKIPFISLTCNFKGEECVDDFGVTLKYEEFYNSVRSGEMPTTSQINVFRYKEVFKEYATTGTPLIYIAFSSALSGSYNSAVLARQELLEEYKDADITVIDSRSASMGEGLLVYYAVEMSKKGASKEQIVNWIEEYKLKLNHWFTVEDLGHLKRGGRVSAATAIVGTLLDIKPVLHVDDEGRLIPVTKVKGRKKSLKTLYDMIKERIINPEDQVIAISHGDSLNDMEYLRTMIMENIKVKDCIVNHVGPVIGSHSGPGTVALFFIGEKR